MQEDISFWFLIVSNDFAGYGKTVSHVVIGLKTAKGTKQLKVNKCTEPCTSLHCVVYGAYVYIVLYALVYLFVLFVLRGKGSCNVFLIQCWYDFNTFIIYVILFLSPKFLYHDKS